MNTHFRTDESLILKVRLKIAMFAFKFTYFGPEKIGQHDISPRLMPQYWVFMAPKTLLDVMKLMECKNDTNTPEFFRCGYDALDRDRCL